MNAVRRVDFRVLNSVLVDQIDLIVIYAKEFDRGLFQVRLIDGDKCLFFGIRMYIESNAQRMEFGRDIVLDLHVEFLDGSRCFSIIHFPDGSSRYSFTRSQLVDAHNIIVLDSDRITTHIGYTGLIRQDEILAVLEVARTCRATYTRSAV